MRMHVAISIEETRSWCGVALDIEPHFKSAEQAAITGLFPMEARICVPCAEAIVTAIQKAIYSR